MHQKVRRNLAFFQPYRLLVKLTAEKFVKDDRVRALEERLEPPAEETEA